MKPCSPAQETSAIFRLSGVGVVKIRTDLPKISVFYGNLSVDVGTSTCGKTFHPDRPALLSKTVSKTSSMDTVGFCWIIDFIEAAGAVIPRARNLSIRMIEQNPISQRR